MRISSSQYFNLNVQSMSDQQSALATMYQQISSNKRLLTASDDPLGAAQAVQLTMQGGALSQYATNQTAALSSLHQEDSTLNSVSGVLQAIKTQIVHAGDGSLNDSDRNAIAEQISGYRNQLLSLANTTDANGNYIFGGLKASTAPFANKASGLGVTYSGDLGQRQMQISDGRTIAVGDTGAAIFGSVSPSESAPVAAAGSNSGTATISPVSVSDPSDPLNSRSFTITFSVTASGTTYSVSDPQGDALPMNVAYTASTPITLGGQSVTIDGTPADGDTFTVKPATSAGTDIFETLDNLVNALKQPIGTPAQQATLTNALNTASTQIDNTSNTVLAAQATVGGREQEVTATQTAMQTASTQNASDLANITNIDLVTAISQYELTQNALQGAQMAFSQIQKMSLFDYVGN
jgi:flagellar hook-associated protein 3 FlgL